MNCVCHKVQSGKTGRSHFKIRDVNLLQWLVGLSNICGISFSHPFFLSSKLSLCSASAVRQGRRNDLMRQCRFRGRDLWMWSLHLWPPRQSKGLSGSKHRSYLSKPPLTAGSSGLSLCLTSRGLQIMFLFRGKHGKRQKPLLFRWRISNMGGFMCLLTQTWVLKWWLLFQAKQQCSHDVLTPVVHERWWYYWCDTIRYEVIRYEAIRYEAIRYDMIWYDTIQLYWYWRAVVS